MSFCSQCGKQVEDRARFCPACGAPAGTPAVHASAGAPSVASVSASGVSVGSAAPATAAQAKSAKIVAGVLNALLAVCAFMPWVNVNLYVWSDSFSIPTLLDMANTVREWGSSLGGLSSDVEGVLAGFTVVILGILIIWLVVVVLLIRDAYRYFTNKPGFNSTGAAAVLTLSALFLLVVFALDQMISGSSSGVPSGLVSATGWVWGTVALSIGALVYSEVKEKEVGENA